MTTAAVSLSASNARQIVNVAIVPPSAHDAKSKDFVLGPASSLLYRTKPVETPKQTTATETTNNVANNAPQVNSAPTTQISQPLAPTTHAALAASQTVQTVHTPDFSAAAVTQQATPTPSATLPTASSASSHPAAPTPITTNFAQSSDQNSNAQTDTSHSDNSQPSPSAPQLVQGSTVVQTGAYSAIESSTNSTIRGSGVNVLS
jgi:hypothetical protein